ncbi:MAG: hypothetical protein ACOYJE_04465 [Bacteroidaceae bacterium]|jgi:hypothetical protein
MKRKYCYDQFKQQVSNPRNCYSIRVIKSQTLYEMRKSELNKIAGKKWWEKRAAYCFVMQYPVEPPYIRYDMLKINWTLKELKYCPFCGADLYWFYFYRRDINDYVNEIEELTF